MSDLPPSPLLRQQSAKAPNNDFDEEDFDWRSYFISIREKSWLIILLPLLGLAAGYGYMQRAVPVYSASAILEVESKQKVMDVAEVTEKDWAEKETINTLAATIRSTTFLERLVEREKLDTKSKLFSEATFPSGEEAKRRAVSILAQSLSATPRPNTKLLDITAKHEDAELARDIVIAAAKGVMKWDLEQKSQSVGVANEFLVQEAERQRAKLQESELALQKYRVEKNAVSLEEDQNLIVEQLKDLNTKLSQQTAERVRLETEYAALMEMKSRPDQVINLQIVASHPTLGGLSKAISEKKSEFAALQSRYRSKHPRYIAIQSDIANLESSFKQALPQVAQSLESSLQASLEAAKVNEDKFQQALEGQEKKSFELDRLAIEYNVRKREMESDKAVYESVVNRLKQVDVTKGIEQSMLKIHQLPSLPGLLVWPKPPVILAAGFGGGLTLAVGIVFLLHMLDRTIKTVDQAEKVFKLPVLAAIGKAKISSEAGSVVKHDGHSPVAESFRSLRVMAGLLGKQEDRRIFAVTSAVPSEGKTFNSCNFAVSLSQQGLKTLLIDADLRKPMVSTTIFGEARKPGLTEYLLGQAPLNEAVHSSPDFPNLRIMPAGARSPNPAELLASPAFPQLLELALKHFDRVVIDTAPVIAVSDTLVIAPLVQTVFLVVHWNKTPSTVTQRAINLLAGSGKPPSGVVLNNVPSHSRGYYYYYSQGYYGGKGGYGAPAETT